MIFLPTVFELETWGVYDRGVPGSERIVFKPRMTLNLGNYIATLGFQSTPMGPVSLLPDQMYWFGDLIVAPPTWFFLYTGTGTPTVTSESNTKEPVHAVYWNKQKTLFSNPQIMPVLARINGIEVLSGPGRMIEGTGFKTLTDGSP